jgi:hypothetical protein
MSHVFDPTTLREYDIRGIVGKTLGTKDAYAIGRGFATLVRNAGGTRVAIGFDGRESSPMLENRSDQRAERKRCRCGPRRAGSHADALLCRGRARGGCRHHDHRQPQSGGL